MLATRLVSVRSFVQPRMSFVRPASLTMFRGFATKKYTQDHEWISVKGDVGTIGITEYAQNALGEVVFVDLPETGKSIEAGDQVGAVESVKAASDIYTPVDGEVIESNDLLSSEPDLINSSPEEDGWLTKIKLSKPEQVDALMDEKAYSAFCDASGDH